MTDEQRALISHLNSHLTNRRAAAVGALADVADAANFAVSRIERDGQGGSAASNLLQCVAFAVDALAQMDRAAGAVDAASMLFRGEE